MLKGDCYVQPTTSFFFTFKSISLHQQRFNKLIIVELLKIPEMSLLSRGASFWVGPVVRALPAITLDNAYFRVSLLTIG